MPKGVPLSDKQKQQIYTRYVINGDRQREIAEDFGISSNTVSKVIAEIRKAGEKMAAHSKIVAGDKANGRLQSTTDPHRFEGTCVIGGKKHSKTFTTVNARKATEMWEKWCRDLRDEQEFMDRVERKEPEPLEEIRPIQVIEPAPAPEINVRPWKEVAEERQRRIEYLEGRLEGYESTTQLTTSGPSYVLWAKTDVPKLYGLYGTMEAALAEVDRLNEVAAFLGGGSVFEVEEVAWKG